MINCTRHILASALVSTIVLLPAAASAQDVSEISIVNHFDKPLSFIVGTNPEILPDLPANFTLGVDNQIKTKVLDVKKEAYIHADDGNQDHFAFWGVEVENSQAKFHGYLSKAIAFSWNTKTIVFCTPEEYKKHNSCLG